MAVKNIYTPIVKGKINDLKAIDKIASSVRYGVKPLIEITPVNKKKTSVDKHVDEFVELVGKYASVGDYFVDFYGLLPEDTIKTGENAIVAGYSLLKARGLTVTPTYGFQRNDDIWPNLRELASDFGAGFCFRISVDDLDDLAEETWQQIVERSAQIGHSAKEIDIMIDLRYVGESSQNSMKELVIDFLSYNKNFSDYRSITICGSSALKTVGSVPPNQIKEVTRVELQIWASLFNELNDIVQLRFGDYGVINPDFNDFSETKRGQPSAKIRFTAGDKIIYFRGSSLKSGYDQYHELASKVVSDSRYGHRHSSYGDDYIYKCAHHLDGPGSLSTWVLADMNHHITYTTNQVQKLIKLFSVPRTATEIEEAVESI